MRFCLPVVRTLVVAAVMVAATASFAQTYGPPQSAPEQPFVLPTTVGTSPVEIAPLNPARRSIEFCNPNATATCSVCPYRSRLDSSVITCAVNGAGSVTLPASWCWGKTTTPQTSTLKSAWYGVCSSSGQKLSVFETE